MALREIKIDGEEVLTKECRPVKELTPYLTDLIDDMIETMHEADGVGLAAPQVGILRQICVIDVGPENGTDEPLILINPEIIYEDGEQFGPEGCLSKPGMVGDVRRPQTVKVKAKNRDLKEIEVEGEGLLARALCHEIDHLHGHMYMERVEGGLRRSDEQEEEE